MLKQSISAGVILFTENSGCLGPKAKTLEWILLHEIFEVDEVRFREFSILNFQIEYVFDE